MFNEFDKDGSGSISIEEAKVMLRRLDIPANEVENLVAIHDTNNDGELQVRTINVLYCNSENDR